MSDHSFIRPFSRRFFSSPDFDLIEKVFYKDLSKKLLMPKDDKRMEKSERSTLKNYNQDRKKISFEKYEKVGECVRVCVCGWTLA